MPIPLSDLTMGAVGGEATGGFTGTGETTGGFTGAGETTGGFSGGWAGGVGGRTAGGVGGFSGGAATGATAGTGVFAPPTCFIYIYRYNISRSSQWALKFSVCDFESLMGNETIN